MNVRDAGGAAEVSPPNEECSEGSAEGADGTRSLNFESDSPGRMTGSKSADAGSYGLDSRGGLASEGEAYLDGGKSRPCGRRSRPPRPRSGRPQRRLRPPCPPRLPKPPRPRSFLGGNGGCWVRCIGAEGEAPPSGAACCPAAATWNVSPSRGVIAGAASKASTGSTGAAAAIGSGT